MIIRDTLRAAQPPLPESAHVGINRQARCGAALCRSPIERSWMRH